MPDTYDAVVSVFFLDCLTSSQIELLLERITPALTSNALWLYSDFKIPTKGWKRWRAQFWLKILYGFFRWQTGLSVRELPECENLLNAAGFVCSEQTVLERGFIQCAVFRHQPA
jgi:hypothetical protein